MYFHCEIYNSVEWWYGPKITPTRGLRQGHPLSPYLFIFVITVLARLINRENNQGNLNGMKLSQAAPQITKLLYADDVLLFGKAKHAEVDSIMECLNKYCEWSGQQINLEKSGLFASKGVHAQFLEQIRSQKGYKKLPHNTKYLRVPLFLSSHHKKDFNYLKENLEFRICSWEKQQSVMDGKSHLNQFCCSCHSILFYV